MSQVAAGLRFLCPSPVLSQKQMSVSVLGLKRSNIITIALRGLPPPRLLPSAIHSMDSSVLDREDVQVSRREAVSSGIFKVSQLINL